MNTGRKVLFNYVNPSAGVLIVYKYTLKELRFLQLRSMAEDTYSSVLLYRKVDINYVSERLG